MGTEGPICAPRWSAPPTVKQVPCETSQVLSCVNSHLEMSGACLGFLTGNGAPEVQIHTEGELLGWRCTGGRAEGTRKSHCAFRKDKIMENEKKKRSGGRDTELIWLKIQINYSSIHLKDSLSEGLQRSWWRNWKAMKIQIYSLL